ncbi:hypothetical protein MHPYR_710014 [uncultured Mycobacterium sp.]|uniref:Uncharacterized protein n=1 Tax=uncultured Mycobacterium sp. TaxID=171292 RepID=A0A1Y5PKL6_9MYCO|nr:hypothetical protein MHPYR_710014 [uncultured Mycobacterium sp.]
MQCGKRYLTSRNLSAPGRIRTCDTGFRRAVLYPLSYGGAPAGSLPRTTANPVFAGLTRYRRRCGSRAGVRKLPILSAARR